MTSIYKAEKSIYDYAQVEQGLPENVAGPKAAYTVLASGGNQPDMAEQSAQVERELTASDTSAREREITATGQGEFTQAKNDTVIQIAKADAPVEDRVDAANAVRGAEYQPNLVVEASINQGAQFNPRDTEEHRVHAQRIREQLLGGVASSILESAAVRQAVTELKQEVSAELWDEQSGLGKAAEVTEAIFMPGAIGEVYNNVINDVFPEQMGNIKSFTLPGEAQEFMSQQFQGMTQEERMEALPILKDSLIEHAGIVTDNGFLAGILIDEVFSEALNNRDEDDFNWDRFWNNATGILDTTVILGTAARAGFRFAKAASFGRVMGSIERANPQLARDLHAALVASREGQQVGRMTGMTAEDAMSNIYPSFQGAFNSVTPAGIVDSVKQSQVRLAKIEEDMAFGINYTQEEIAQMQSRVVDAYSEINGSYNQSFSQFQVLEDEGRGFKVKAAFGASEDTGFGSYQDALEHFQTNFPDGTPVDFMVRDGDVVRQADADELWGLQDNEVWYRVEQDYNYNMGLADENALLFGGQPIDSASSFSEGARFASRFALDPASRFSRFVAKAASRATDLGQGIRGRMTDQLTNNFLKLNRNGQVRVMEVVDEGSSQQRNFDYHDLQGFGLNDAEIRSYFDIRGLMDLEWRLNNTRVYNTLQRDGFESVVNYATGFEEFGRRVAQSDVPLVSGRARVFDPDTNRIVSLTAEDLATLYDNSGTVLKSKSVLKGGDEGVTYIASGLGEGTKIRPLALNPLSYRPGYVTRFYDENYFIKMRKTEVVDGVKQQRMITVAAAPTNPEASKLLAALQKQNPDAEFIKQLDKSLDHAEALDNEFDYLHRTGGVITGRRGDILKGIDEAAAQTVDPVKSMMDSISYTAQRVSHDDLIASFEKRWVNTYGKKFGQHKEGQQHFTVPDNLNDIKGDTPSAKGVQEARDHAAYIQAMKGTQGDAAQAWRSSMISIAEHLDNMFDTSRVGKRVTDVIRKANPVSTLRGMAFTVLVASNPTRQLLLQANQLTFLTGMAPKYVVGGGLARDLTAFMMASATRNRPMWGKMRPRLAKLMKMSESDFEFMFDAYVRSGLPYSIDSHSFARDGFQALQTRITGNYVERSGRAIGNAVKAPIRAVKAVGFDPGEWINLTSSWLVGLQDWRKKNPGRNWKTKAAMDDYSTEARDLAFNMTKSGDLPYQRGFLSLSTQFLSYQHKALLAIASQNKAFASLTPLQRVGIGAFQFAMYGADSIGMGASWEKVKDNLGLDIPESANAIMDGFVYEYMMNATINSLSRDGTDINFSSTLAPGSGILGSFSDYIATLTTADLPTIALGASASAISRVDQATRMAMTVFQIPDLSRGEQLGAALQQAGQIFGGYSNYVKGRAMMEIGYAVSNSGQPLYKTTYAEGFAKALFGIGPEAQQDYYRILQDVNGRFTGEKFLDSIGGPDSSDIDAIAETYYERISKIYRDMSVDTIDGRDELWYNQLESQIALENTVLAVLPKDVSQAVINRVRTRVARNYNDTGVDQLISYMTDAVIGGTQALSTREHYLNLLKQADFKYTPEQIQDIESLVDYMIDTEGLE